ncbi:Gamma-glutamyl-GABA hydrolase [gamma proteobacterium IMCC2047]|nr:Gamma-glutamyl-GABA hydrolase [gamma proteobacterium IMCC2047]
MSHKHKPVIGIICDAFSRDGKADRLFHGVAEEYIRAIRDGTDCQPLLIPVLTNDVTEADTLCQTLDGILLTGSRTNVHPVYYGGETSKAGTLHDEKRDRTALALIQAALKFKLPVFGICRGFQEINVALGGTLHQNLSDLDGRLDHAKYLDYAQHQQYQDCHEINLTSNGYFHHLLGESRISINSLHYQGVDRLADSLSLEGSADDGTPEAFSLSDNSHFFIATQWHPEWYIDTDPISQALFNAFNNAVHDYAASKLAQSRTNG